MIDGRLETSGDGELALRREGRRQSPVVRTILSIDDDHVQVDVGFKSEGLIPLEEFRDPEAIEPGDEVVVGIIGYFGQRLAELAHAAGATVRLVEAPWGQILDPQQIADEFENGPVKLVALVHAETSTGAAQPLAEIGQIVRENDALLMVDCVTSLGGMQVDVDGWHIDAAGSCSQKCIGAPPGLGPITVGNKARVGANSVVVKDVPSGQTVVGIPGKLVSVREAGDVNPYGIDLNHHLIPDPVAEAVHCLLERIRLLEQQVCVHGCLPDGRSVDDECDDCDAKMVCEPGDVEFEMRQTG